MKFDDFSALLDDNPFAEIPVDVVTFVESNDYLNQPPLSKIQYDIVESMAQIYKEEDVIRFMGVTAGRHHFAKYTKKEIIMALGKGSIIGEDEVYDPVTGQWNRIDSLQEAVWSTVQGVDKEGNAMVQNSTESFIEGYQEVFRVELQRGLFITVSADHAFYDKNYERVKLKDLKIGDKVAVLRKTDITNPVKMNSDEIIALGLWLGDGAMPVDQPRRKNLNMDFSSKDAVAQQVYLDILYRNGDDPYIKINPNGKAMTYVRSNSKKSPWALEVSKKYGLWGKKAHDKRVPKEVFSLPDEQLALFLGALWGTDGTVYLKKSKNKSHGVLEYATISEGLATDIQRLLTRFGILATLRSKIPKYSYNGEIRTGQKAYYLSISDADGFLKFYKNIKLYDKQHLLDAGANAYRHVKGQCDYDRDVFFAKIKSVTKEVMPEPVFTMTAVDTTNYVANLVLNGNSGK